MRFFFVILALLIVVGGSALAQSTVVEENTKTTRTNPDGSVTYGLVGKLFRAKSCCTFRLVAGNSRYYRQWRRSPGMTRQQVYYSWGVPQEMKETTGTEGQQAIQPTYGYKLLKFVNNRLVEIK